MFSNQESNFDILMDLNGFIQHLLAELSESKDHLIQDSNPYLLKVCFSVEKILSHHLKDVNLIGQTTIWDFLQNLPKCLPGTSGVIDLAKDCSKTSIGRGRVFIRGSLNTGSLGDYISALSFNADLLKTYYKDTALLKDGEFMNTFQSLLDSLSHINFCLQIKDKELDKITYWEDVAISLLSQTPKKPVQQATPTPSQQPIPMNLSSDNTVTTTTAPIIPAIKAPTISTPNIESNIEYINQSEIVVTSPTITITTATQAAIVDNSTSSEKRKFYDSRKSLNLDELNDALDDLLDDDNTVEKEKNNLEYEILIDSLAKTKKSVILEYGAKGAPLTVSDQCIDSLCFAIDQIISHEIKDSVSHSWQCVMKLCQGSQDILNINALHSNDSIRMKSWYFKSLTEATLSEAIRLSFSDEPTLKQLYKDDSILLQRSYRSQIYSILSDLLSAAHFQLKWNLDLQPQQPQQNISLNSSQSNMINLDNNTSNPVNTGGVVKKTIVTKIIKKKIKKPTTPIKSSNENLGDLTTTTTQNAITRSTSIDTLSNSKEEIDNTSATTATSPYVVSPPTQSPDLSGTPISEQQSNNNNNYNNISSMKRIDSLAELSSLENVLNSLDDDNNNHVIDEYKQQSITNNRSILTEMMQQHNQQQNELKNNHSNSSLTSSQNNMNIQSSISSMDDELDQSDPTISNSNSYTNSFTNIHDAYSKSYQPNPNLINNAINSHYNQSVGISTQNGITAGVPNRKSSIISASLDSFQFITDYSRDEDENINSGNGGKRNINIPNIKSNNITIKEQKKNRLEGEDGIFINQLYRKPGFNEMNNQLCPSCNAFLDKLGFFKVRFCYYTGKHFCNNCHHNEKAMIPARILYRWDFRLYVVSDLAKTYLTIHSSTPFDIFQFNPEVYNISGNLQKVLMMRRKLFYIYEYIETCRNKSQLDQTTLKEYFIKDNVNLYSLVDLDQVSTGLLENVVENALIKYVQHVSKTCETCMGKGFICEYCGNGDNLIFSWMKLDINTISQCDKCHSLSHKRCGNKSTCPKCIRIDRVKSRSVTNTNGSGTNNLNSSTSSLNFNTYTNHNSLIDPFNNHNTNYQQQQPQNNYNNMNFNINTSNSLKKSSNFSDINWI